MLDHVTVHVQDLPRVLAFYKAALAPIGYTVAMEFPSAAGLGEGGKIDLWIAVTDKPLRPLHIAFPLQPAPGRRVPRRARWRRAAPTTARPACGPTTTRTITRRS